MMSGEASKTGWSYVKVGGEGIWNGWGPIREWVGLRLRIGGAVKVGGAKSKWVGLRLRMSEAKSNRRAGSQNGWG